MKYLWRLPNSPDHVLWQNCEPAPTVNIQSRRADKMSSEVPGCSRVICPVKLAGDLSA